MIFEEMEKYYEINLNNIDKCFIYFLCKDNDVVYIGQTRCGIQRPMQHTDKSHNIVRIINCSEVELDEIEMKYIHKYEPIYNKQIYGIECDASRYKYDNPISNLAKLTNRSTAAIYKVAKKLNRLPTIDEIKTKRKRGRPRKLNRLPTIEEINADRKGGRPKKYV